MHTTLNKTNDKYVYYTSKHSSSSCFPFL